MKFVHILFIAFLLSSCAKRKVETRFYLIEPQSQETELTASGSPDKVCQISPVKVYPAFANSKIAHRSESHQITYYNHHQWAVLPEIQLTSVVEYYLQQQNIFKQVDARPRLKPDYILNTRVIKIETVSDKNDLSAHIHMDFRLVDALEQNIILEHTTDRYEALPKKDINLFADAVNDILYQELLALSGKIKDQVINK